jgi:hypothetical protein
MVKFTDVVRYMKMPYKFDLFLKKNPKWCRYSANIYGYSFNNKALILIFD